MNRIRWLLSVLLCSLILATFLDRNLELNDGLRIALRRFEDHVGDMGINPEGFVGPKRTIRVSNVPYTFEWTHNNAGDEVVVMITVDCNGETEISGTGPIEKLETNRGGDSKSQLR